MSFSKGQKHLKYFNIVNCWIYTKYYSSVSIPFIENTNKSLVQNNYKIRNDLKVCVIYLKSASMHDETRPIKLWQALILRGQGKENIRGEPLSHCGRSFCLIISWHCLRCVSRTVNFFLNSVDVFNNLFFS